MEFKAGDRVMWGREGDGKMSYGLFVKPDPEWTGWSDVVGSDGAGGVVKDRYLYPYTPNPIQVMIGRLQVIAEAGGYIYHTQPLEIDTALSVVGLLTLTETSVALTRLGKRTVSEIFSPPKFPQVAPVNLNEDAT